eukprot:403370136
MRISFHGNSMMKGKNAHKKGLLENKLLIIILLGIFCGIVQSQIDPAVLTTKCRSECLDTKPVDTWYFCRSSRNEGYCCMQGDQTANCQPNPELEIECTTSIVASGGFTFMKYAYCPRRTNICGTSGSVLHPLLNQNQSVSVHKSMTLANDDVCYWQFIVNTAAFKISHPNMDVQDLYLNVVLTGSTNVVSYLAQGVITNGTNSTTNPAPNTAFKYRMNESQSIFLIAYPDTQVSTIPVSLNFTYNLTADYYPVTGMTTQLQAEIYPDVSRSSLWIALAVIAALGLIIILIVTFVICCKDFDPENDFEKRRKRLAKDRKKREKQQKKQEAKDAKNNKKTTPAKATTTKKQANDDYGDEYYDEDYGDEEAHPSRGKNAKKSNTQTNKNTNASKKPVKKSLETEIRLNDDKKGRKKQYEEKFLPDEDSD